MTVAARTVVVSVTLPAGVVERLDELATEQRVSRAELLRRAAGWMADPAALAAEVAIAAAAGGAS